MATFVPLERKGLDGCWVESSLDPDQLKLHISEVAPGTRSHDPHRHQGAEAVYVLEGNGTIETEDGPKAVGPNQVLILDARNQHGIVNTGSTVMRYMVIVTP